MLECAACGVRTRHPSPGRCRCGALDLWFPPESAELGPREHAVRGDAPLADGEATHYIQTGLIDELFEGRGIPCPSSILFYGSAGSGKSRTALQLAPLFQRTLIVHLEYPRAEAVRMASELAVKLDHVWFLPSLAGWEEEATSIGAQLVFIDSISACARPISVLRAMADWAKHARAVCIGIAHANKRGRVSGSTALEHWPDAVIVARGGPSSTVELSTPKKNRHGMTGPGSPRVRVGLLAPGTIDTGGRRRSRAHQ